MLFCRLSCNLFLAKEMKHLRQLEDLRDEILANHVHNFSTPGFSEMCEADLKLLQEWNWNQYVYCNCIKL